MNRKVVVAVCAVVALWGVGRLIETASPPTATTTPTTVQVTVPTTPPDATLVAITAQAGSTVSTVKCSNAVFTFLTEQHNDTYAPPVQQAHAIMLHCTLNRLLVEIRSEANRIDYKQTLYTADLTPVMGLNILMLGELTPKAVKGTLLAHQVSAVQAALAEDASLFDAGKNLLGPTTGKVATRAAHHSSTAKPAAAVTVKNNTHAKALCAAVVGAISAEEDGNTKVTDRYLTTVFHEAQILGGKWEQAILWAEHNSNAPNPLTHLQEACISAGA